MSETALRERRRRQTEREIGDAALELFESRGVDGTTVDDIARAAGISPRTFFRYFPSKERAALVPHVDLDERVEALLQQLVPSRPLLDQLEEVWRAVMRDFDNGRSESGRLLLRVRRLMQHEPALRLAAVGYDEERTDALVARLRDLVGAEDDLAPRVAVEAAGVAVRVALDRWADSRETSRTTDLLETYAETCRLLRGTIAP
ncbi:TetR family transcriptional regulator [Nocardioides aurantiacus]|uniref:TetR family transcriptional regulator n=1 Tax=Nocardioides aurantiacus TaxID=86796 RepID=A0A3N2CPD2_9ACTN|nr:TetR/AcrR family transcriptional regulator [Nocardioides aurantiacus]ROR89372.1 TetR family transcriptional regulator [Nocardioides aurantiacus]